jgi:Cu-Zn family superoxide dismutase
MKSLTVAIAALAWAAWLGGAAHAQAKASAEIKDAAGKKVGEAILEQQEADVLLTATFSGLPPGTRAFHIHETGRCEPPFESAGGHFNPTKKQHGKDNPQGPHLGDLPNLEVPASGHAKIELTIKGLALDRGPQPLLDGDGAALVVHEGADDHRSDPAGNAGKRIACGVIRR